MHELDSVGCRDYPQSHVLPVPPALEVFSVVPIPLALEVFSVVVGCLEP